MIEVEEREDTNGAQRRIKTKEADTILLCSARGALFGFVTDGRKGKQIENDAVDLWSWLMRGGVSLGAWAWTLE